MAIDQKKLEQINKLLKDIDNAFKSMGQKNVFDFDINKVQDADEAIRNLENTLDAVEARARTINGSFGDLVDILQAVSGELKGQDKALKNAQDSLKSNLKILTDQVQKLKFEEQGYGIESEKNARAMLKKAQQAKNFALDNAKFLTKELDVEIKKGKIYKKNTDQLADITDAQKAAVLIAAEEAKLLQDAVDKIAARVNLEDQFNRKLLFSAKLAGGFDKALQKAGFPALGIADAIEKTREEFIASNVELDKKGKKYFVLVGLVKNLGKNLFEALSFQNMLQLGVAALFKALKEVDATAGEFAKTQGISYQRSLEIRKEFNETAQSAGDILISSNSLLKTQGELNNLLGSSVMFSKETVKQFDSLSRRTKMTAETQKSFLFEVLKTGKSANDITKEVNLQTFELSKQKGLQISVKQVQDAIGKAASSIFLTFKGSNKELASQVISAKALGVELNEVAGIASSLLDFESSIQAELEAELLLGKEINLERARAAALQGDFGKVADEVLKNRTIMNAFETKNVIAQEAAAKSLGMSREQLADMIKQQKILEGIRSAGLEDQNAAQARYNELREQGKTVEEAAQEVGALALADQMESASQAEKLEAVMTRVQEIFIQLALPILDALEGTKGIEESAKRLADIIKGIVIAYGAIKAAMFVIQTYQAAQIIQSTRALAIDTARAAAAATSASSATLGIGAVAVIAGITAIMGAIAGYMYANDAVFPGQRSGYGDRVLLGPEGIISFNNKDTIVAGTNLFADDVVSQPPGAISMDMGNNEVVEKMDKLIEKTDQLITATTRDKVVRLEDGSLLGQLIYYQSRNLQ